MPQVAMIVNTPQNDTSVYFYLIIHYSGVEFIETGGFMSLKTARTLYSKSMDDVVAGLAASVLSFDLNVSVEKQIKKFLKDNDLKEGEILRRDYDGVSECRYLVTKMIGEYLCYGAPKF